MTDAVLAKLATIRRCLNRIRDVTGGDPGRVRELDTQEIVVLNLQRAIQAAIDLAAQVISRQDWGLPDSLKAHFTILRREGIIGEDLCTRLEAMVGFRNIAVHGYEVLDTRVLERIVTERLPDLEAFSAVVTSFLDDSPEKAD
jgi:uncharacterized protein YutE (UPF0331/DUF86 family)